MGLVCLCVRSFRKFLSVVDFGMFLPSSLVEFGEQYYNTFLAEYGKV